MGISLEINLIDPEANRTANIIATELIRSDRRAVLYNLLVLLSRVRGNEEREKGAVIYMLRQINAVMLEDLCRAGNYLANVARETSNYETAADVTDFYVDATIDD